MFPDRQPRSFLDHARPVAAGELPAASRGGRCRGTSRAGIPARIAGSSVEFAEYRKYVPGDDLRRLDWRAYGRSDRFYVKEFEADTNLRCCLVLDTSGSMDFGSDGHHQDRICPEDRRGARRTWRSSKETRSACRAWPRGSSGTSRRGGTRRT